MVLQWHRENDDARIASRQCPVCLGDYGDVHVPTIIHCGHSVCITCARQLCRRVPQQHQRERPTYIITCPVCRQDGIETPNRLRRNYSLIPGYIRPRPEN
ncbi:unnamed protein product [Caenorhabditis brenneri]